MKGKKGYFRKENDEEIVMIHQSKLKSFDESFAMIKFNSGC